MGKIILGGVIKCAILYSLFILAFGGIVNNGMQCVDSDDENYNDIHMQEMIHKNTQATTMLLAPCVGMNTTKLVV
jgi:amino acid transporter